MGTDFYFYVGGIELASELAGGYRKALIRLVGFNQKVITVEEKNYLFKGRGGGADDFVLPSLNLTPKVHKLKEAASVYNEKDLTARPIVTGYGWSVVKASRFCRKILGK